MLCDLFMYKLMLNYSLFLWKWYLCYFELIIGKKIKSFFEICIIMYLLKY